MNDQANPEQEYRGHETWVGRILPGNYRLDRLLGTGGFASVFHATKQGDGKAEESTYAVKILHRPELSEEVDLARRSARFHREFELCSRLEHDAIVRPYHSDQTHDGYLYAVFEYVPGQNLAQLLAERRNLTAMETAQLLGQVLDALAYAHAQGVVHRDLKPANIMVTGPAGNQRVKILDFGIGTLIHSARPGDFKSLTLTTEAVGTPAYTAPEQLRGEPPTPKSDIYAWGLIFLECLIGRPVITGSTLPEIVHQQLSSEPIPLPPNLVSHPLGQLLSHALERDMSRRAGDVVSLGAALRSMNLGDLVAFAPELATTRTVQTARETRQVGAERRQVTVLSCNVQASLLRISDDEDFDFLDELARDQQHVCHEIAERYSAHAEASLGSRTVLLFGYPVVTDESAAQAARAALELVDIVRRRSTALREQRGIDLQVSVGMHTGVVVADGRPLASGLTVSAANRLESVASPGTIVVSEASRTLLKDSFVLQPTTPGGSHRTLPSGGLEAWTLVQERRAHHQSMDDAKSPLAGREAELRELQLLWDQARSSRGESVLIQGIPGIGKSRLVRELRRDIPPYAGYSTRCLPEWRMRAFAPLRDIVKQRLRLDGEAQEDAVDIVRRECRRLGLDTDTAVPLLCEWLGTPLSGSYTPLPHSPQGRRALLIQHVVDLWAKDPDRTSLLVFEDVHWADPSTLEFLNVLVQVAPRANLLVVLTARPEFEGKWTTTSPRVLRLDGLPEPAVRQVIASCLPDRDASEKWIAEVVERSAGVPLFVEELTRMVTHTTGRIDSIDGLPATLREVLASRIDGLGAAKETIRVAALLGRDFSHAVLIATNPERRQALEADLDLLVRTAVLSKRNVSGAEVYTFRHALVQEAAYRSMLAEDRKKGHQRIADTLQESFPEIVESQPAVLAYHHGAAERFGAACGYGMKAALGALMGGANEEAVSQIRQALEWAGKLEEGTTRAKLEVQLLSVLTPALMATRGWADEELNASYERSLELLDVVPEEETLTLQFMALVFCHNRGILRNRVRQHAWRLEAAARRLANPVIHGYGRLGRANWHFIGGELVEAEREFTRTIDEYVAEQHVQSPWIYGWDVETTARIIRAPVRIYLGKVTEGVADLEQAVARARQIGHQGNVGMTYAYAAVSHHARGDHEAVARMTADLLRLSADFGLPAYVPYAQVLRGWALRDPTLAEQGLATLEAFGQLLARSYYATVVAETYLERAEIEPAARFLDVAEQFAEQSGEGYYLPAIWIERGKLLAMSTREHPEAALEALERARTLARERHARLFELKAELALQKLNARVQNDGGGSVPPPPLEGFDDVQSLPTIAETLSVL